MHVEGVYLVDLDRRITKWNKGGADYRLQKERWSARAVMTKSCVKLKKTARNCVLMDARLLANHNSDEPPSHGVFCITSSASFAGYGKNACIKK
jgi:hypothetical protein